MPVPNVEGPLYRFLVSDQVLQAAAPIWYVGEAQSLLLAKMVQKRNLRRLD